MAPLFEVLPSTSITENLVRSIAPHLNNGIKQDIQKPILVKFRPEGGTDMVSELAKEIEAKVRGKDGKHLVEGDTGAKIGDAKTGELPTIFAHEDGLVRVKDGVFHLVTPITDNKSLGETPQLRVWERNTTEDIGKTRQKDILDGATAVIAGPAWYETVPPATPYMLIIRPKEESTAVNVV